MGWAVLPLVLALPWLVSCQTPIGASRAPVSRVYHELRHSALEGGECSDLTRSILHRYNGESAFRSRPADVLRRLHQNAVVEGRSDLLLALAELNYFHAERLRRSLKRGEPRQARDYFFASAIYACYYLDALASQPETSFLGRCPELARDLYNRALAQGLQAPAGASPVVLLQEGTRQLLVGPVDVQLNTNGFPSPLSVFSEFVMADAYSVKGLSVRNRQSGFGAPLIATVPGQRGAVASPRLALTVLLRVAGSLKDWSAGQAKVSLELYPGYPGSRVELGGHSLPLEIDATAPLACALNNADLWKLGRRQFFSSREIIKSDVYRLQPYRAGLIPLVFVHGTFSSPVCWGEMWNTLVSDPVLSRRYQLWAFIYNSGNPLAWSAAKLRDALRDTVAKLDPQGADLALHQIVLIGHSQGGLLAKLTVTPTGDTLWRLVSDKSLDELALPDDARAELRRTLLVETVPQVKRVIYLATPHRGSFRANQLVRRLAARAVPLPREIVRYANETSLAGGQERLPLVLSTRIPNSLDGMSPSNPVLLKLSDLEPAAGVTCHSIVAIKGRGPVEQGNDGIVTYQSAHVSYAASELVVRASHSCQGQPAVIEEVRRILLEHLAHLDAHRDLP